MQVGAVIGVMFRVVFVLVGAVAQALFAFAPELFGITQSIETRSDEFDTILIPAGPAFAIWLPLFFGAIVFALAHAARATDPLYRRLGWWVGLSFAANAVWALYQPVYGPGPINFLLLETILWPLIVAMVVLRRHQGPSPLVVSVPIYGLAGWLTIASPVGLSLTLNYLGAWPFAQDELVSALIVLAGWAPLALMLTWLARSLVFAGAVAWGLGWLSLAAFGDGLPMLAYVAAGAAVLVLLLTAVIRRRRAPAD